MGSFLLKDFRRISGDRFHSGERLLEHGELRLGRITQDQNGFISHDYVERPHDITPQLERAMPNKCSLEKPNPVFKV
jgi:hypothetical protein